MGRLRLERDTRVDLLFSARPLHAARDDDLLRDLLVDGGDVVMARAAMECSDHGRIAAREHAQDASLGAAIVALAAQFHQHLVAVHGRSDCWGGMKMSPADGTALVGIGDHEAIAIAMHGQAAGDQVLACGGVFREGIAIASGLDQPGALHQRLQAFGELLPLLAAQIHLADQLLVARGLVGLAFNMPQDGLIGEHVFSSFVTSRRRDRRLRPALNLPLFS